MILVLGQNDAGIGLLGTDSHVTLGVEDGVVKQVFYDVCTILARADANYDTELVLVYTPTVRRHRARRTYYIHTHTHTHTHTQTYIH